MEDYYKILGVDETASEADIKKAYRTLAKEYHPDSGGDSVSEDKFKKIAEAWETLSDPSKKTTYDTTRKFGDNPFVHFNMGGFGTTNPNDPFSIFSHFSNIRPQKYPLNIEMDMSVTLEDVYTGKITNKKYNRYVPCSSCNGLGCADCKNDGVILREESINIDCKTIRQSNVYPVNAAGNFMIGAIMSGQLLVKVILDNSTYTIKNDDLYYDLKVHYQDAIDGVKWEYKHLDGKTYSIDIPTGSNTGNIMKMGNMGLMKTNVRGDLYFNVLVYVDYERLNKEDGNESSKNG